MATILCEVHPSLYIASIELKNEYDKLGRFQINEAQQEEFKVDDKFTVYFKLNGENKSTTFTKERFCYAKVFMNANKTKFVQCSSIRKNGTPERFIEKNVKKEKLEDFFSKVALLPYCDTVEIMENSQPEKTELISKVLIENGYYLTSANVFKKRITFQNSKEVLEAKAILEKNGYIGVYWNAQDIDNEVNEMGYKMPKLIREKVIKEVIKILQSKHDTIDGLNTSIIRQTIQLVFSRTTWYSN